MCGELLKKLLRKFNKTCDYTRDEFSSQVSFPIAVFSADSPCVHAATQAFISWKYWACGECELGHCVSTAMNLKTFQNIARLASLK